MKRAGEEAQICDRAPGDEVLLDDAFESLRRAAPVPDALRVDDRDRPVGADAQAVGDRLVAAEQDVAAGGGDAGRRRGPNGGIVRVRRAVDHGHQRR
jgi:hypothetical protein